MLTATPPPGSTRPRRAPSGLTGPGLMATWGSAPPPGTRAPRSAPGPWATAGARDSATRVRLNQQKLRQNDETLLTCFQIVPPMDCAVLTAALTSVWMGPSPRLRRLCLRSRPPITRLPRRLCRLWRPSLRQRRWRLATATPRPRCPWSSPSPSPLHLSCPHYMEPLRSK